MRPIAWSSLLAGAVLATVVCASARAEDAGEGRFARHGGTLPEAAPIADTDPAADDASLRTGSIAPLEAPDRPALGAVPSRRDGGLHALSSAPASTATAPATTTETTAAPTGARPAETATTAPDAASAPSDPAAEAATVPGPLAPSAAAPETPVAAEPAGTAPASAAVAAPASTAAIDPAPTVEAPSGAATGPAPAPRTSSAAPQGPTPQALAPQASAPSAPPTPAPATPAPEVRTPVIPSPATEAQAPVAPAPAVVPAVAETRPAVAAPQPSTDSAVAAAYAEQQAADAVQKAIEPLALKAGPADERAERAAVAAFYRERAGKPLFTAAEGLSSLGRSVAGRLAAADRDGLEPRDYALPTPRAATPEARADVEIATALTTLRYARHLASGRFDPGRLSDLVTPKPPRPDPAKVLAELAAAADPGAALAAWAPPHEGYRRLRAELARLRGETEVPIVRLPEGPLLKPGQRDDRVAVLRERLGVGAVASDADQDVYDPALAEAVKSFQRERGLAATGAVGRATVLALNEESRGNADRIADVVVNMERWRWLPRDLGELHVFVNVPDFSLDVMKEGRSIHHARVVTGRPENQTPIFSETMQYLVVNPYWNVPVSIVQKEMLAKAQASNGEALNRGNYEVEVDDQSVDPTTVDWTTMSARRVSIRQRPGDGNALGNIKFMFPNQHSVYIHDTSSRGLFAQSYRALSHGCVRVHEPFAFADALLSEEPGGLDGARLKKMLGGGEKEITLKRRIPVHIAYFTVWVDDAGQVQTRRDVYGHDAKMRRILGL